MLLPLFIYRSTTSTFRSVLLLCVLLLFSHLVEKEIPLPNSPSPKKKIQNNMEKVEDIVIVGAGIAGLTTSLGLQKYSSSLSYIYIYACTTFFLIFGLILKNCYSAYVQFLSPFFLSNTLEGLKFLSPNNANILKIGYSKLGIGILT